LGSGFCVTCYRGLYRSVAFFISQNNWIILLILRRDHILKIWEKLCNINEVSTGDNIQEISVYLPGVKKKEKIL